MDIEQFSINTLLSWVLLTLMSHFVVQSFGPCFTFLPLSTAFPRHAGIGTLLGLEHKQAKNADPTSSASTAPKARAIPVKPLMLHLGMDFATVFESMCIQCASWAS